MAMATAWQQRGIAARMGPERADDDAACALVELPDRAGMRSAEGL